MLDHFGGPPGIGLFLRAVKDDPGAEIDRHILEAMWDVRGREEQVSGAYRHYAILEAVMPQASGNDINFVPRMRRVKPIGQFGGEPDFEVTITKNLRRTL
jgi:hypothetical protein